ncbi:type 4a pilus biogenesis protein PilO [Paenibacillus sp. F411]|uniref:type 4a pilus biogenesis protein PilO n=1 Tax=Paenibacillus sp. F411 TaxID=2820239 RepID=UPI001AAFADBE|nr:type 4a pilus biogenesis protein PilO [Paenibacillus sp. F411]
MELLNKYRSPVVMGVLLLFVVLLGFYLLGLQPTIDTMEEQEAEIARVSDEKALLQRKVDELKGAADSQDQELLSSYDALPEGDEADQLVLQLRTAGIRSSARLKSIEFNLTGTNGLQLVLGGNEGAYPFIKEVSMNAEVEGTRAQIIAWMDQLEKMPRIIKVDSFSLQRRSGPSELPENALLTANVVFTAYYESSQRAATVTP